MLGLPVRPKACAALENCFGYDVTGSAPQTAPVLDSLTYRAGAQGRMLIMPLAHGAVPPGCY